jgi:murein endopeptidase
MPVVRGLLGSAVFTLAVLVTVAAVRAGSGVDGAGDARVAAGAPALLPLSAPYLDSGPAGGRRQPRQTIEQRAYPRIHWRRSRAVGLAYSGRLVRGVRLPREGRHYFTWDGILHTSPNRWWRRYGTDRLVRVLLRVTAAYRRAHPRAPRVAVGDLSRPHGGDFGPRYGGDGHASHQNGLDLDIYYPRRDRRERQPTRVRQIDRRLAQDLVDRFVRAGAERIFVGPRTGLEGPRGIVEALVNHDDHLHVRIRPERRGH